VVSFDLNSLYPHLIMQYSISPENLVTDFQIENRISDLEKSLS
jgi:DNA polymerase elongation subunit (family B)